MPNFLIIAKPLQPETADLHAAACHWREIAQSKGAEVFVIGDRGGFIVQVDVADHEELMDILMTNPTNRWGEYEVIPLISPEAEHQILTRAGAV